MRAITQTISPQMEDVHFRVIGDGNDGQKILALLVIRRFDHAQGGHTRHAWCSIRKGPRPQGKEFWENEGWVGEGGGGRGEENHGADKRQYQTIALEKQLTIEFVVADAKLNNASAYVRAIRQEGRRSQAISVPPF